MTAETALVLPVLALVLATGMWLVSAVTARVRCIDAAREAARALARGDDPEQARMAALADAPSGASLSVSRDGDRVEAHVRFRLAPGGLLPGYLLDESAVTAVEPESGDP